jgi:hypothetical protein
MKTFLIQFHSRTDGEPRGAAFIDLDIPESELVALVKSNGGEPTCKHCRGVVGGKIINRAYELNIAPAGTLVAHIHDVSADPRVAAFDKHRLLKHGAFVDAILEGVATSGAVH